VLRPHAVIRAGGDVEHATHLHHVAHEKCYIANSVNFPILCEPVVETQAC
jgi:organic hydroperoxide reductase OsmC/OhrA